jgi:hypothetical protein
MKGKRADKGSTPAMPDERTQIANRLDSAVYQKVAEAARINNCSVSAEAARRIAQSFEEDQASEGSDALQDLGRDMMSAFVAGGRRESRRLATRGRQEPPVSEWMLDPTCYTAAANSALGILAQWHPRPLYGHCVLMIRSLTARLDALWLALVNNEESPEERRKLLEHADEVIRNMTPLPSLFNLPKSRDEKDEG